MVVGSPTPVQTTYTLDQAEQDIATLRGQVDQLSEILKFTDSASDWGPTTTGAWLYSLNGILKFAADDGNNYQGGTFSCQNVTTDAVNSTTPTFPTGFDFNVMSGLSYAAIGVFTCSMGSTAAGITVQVNGPTVTDTRITYVMLGGPLTGVSQTPFVYQLSALNTNSGSGNFPSGNTIAANRFFVLIAFASFQTFTASGTLQWGFGEATSGDSWTIQIPSTVTYFPIT
jgi:hypothetical protein